MYDRLFFCDSDDPAVAGPSDHISGHAAAGEFVRTASCSCGGGLFKFRK